MVAKLGSKIDPYWEIATFDQKRDIWGSMVTNVPTYGNYELTNIEISTLYQALSDISEMSRPIWSERQDLNLRPLRPKRSVLAI